VTRQKVPKKKAHELTTDEAVKRLFHPKVVDHAKAHVREADERVPGPKKKSTDAH
jgi:hypothetical protein